MTAGDGGQPQGGWVPTPPAQEPETAPITRASLRRAREEQAAKSTKAAQPAPPARSARSDAEWVAVDSPSVAVLGVAVGTSVALSVLIGLSALVGPFSTTLAVGFTAVVMAWGWPVLTSAPSRRGGAAVLAAGVVAVCATAGLTRTEPYLVWVPVAVAVSVIAAFLQQVLRPGGRPRLTAGMAGAVGALAVTASGVGLIPLPRYSHGGPWVLVAMVSVAAGSLLLPVTARRVSALWGLLPVLVLGAAGALVMALVLTGIPLLAAALTGVLAPVVAHATQRVLLGLPGSRGAQAAIGAGAASVLVVGVVVYLLARLYAG